MSVYNTSEEQVCFEELRNEDITEISSGVCRLSGSEVREEHVKNEHSRQSSIVGGRGGGGSGHPGAGGGGGSSNMEQEKRMRREIANSNERRRMKSINAGFQSLRTLLPHHEGEKLSKAAILQQTAEYIYQLEQQKTGLLSQNCQLKRLLNQLETSNSGSVMKKQRRLLDSSGGLTSLSETSADEGIGSMSPEPSSATMLESADHAREMVELRVQLGRERKLRMDLEEQVRTLQGQLYPEPQQLVPLSLMQETAAAVAHLQVVSGSAVPAIGQTTVVTSSSPVHYMRSPSPMILPHPVESPPPPTCIVRDAGSPTPPPPPPALSPPPGVEQRLPSILEAAIKAEPKVEVERLPSPSTASDDVTPQSRLYAASTSRQNLETIVEAIRHLEGDQFINDGPTTTVSHTSPGNVHQLVVSEPSPQHLVEQQPQEAPLALTTTHRHVKLEVNPPYLHFHPSSSVQRVNSMSTSVVTALQQQRPGVIVVKHT